MPNLLQAVPRKQITSSAFKVIDTGLYYSLVIKTNGSLWSWGGNFNGVLGDNSVVTRFSPIAVCGNKTFCKISGSNNGPHNLGIDKNGKSWAWGYNLTGQLGDNTITSRLTPVAVCGNKTFCQIAAGGNFQSYGIDKNGKAWAWGSNSSGQLGDNTITSRRTPVAVCGNKTFCKISSSGNHVLSIDKNGKLWGWGFNGNGRIGDNTTVSKITPVAVCGNKTFCQISAGNGWSLGIDKNGKGWGWGNNTGGLIGDNTITQRLTPVAICGNKTFCKISAGNTHSVAIDKNGQAWAWGVNYQGQLGIQSTLCSTICAVSVCGLITFCEVSVGFTHTLGLDKNNNIWAWGFNPYGLLGANDYSAAVTPIAIYGNKTFCTISNAVYNSMGVDNNGKGWTWGRNVGLTRLGDGSSTPNVFTPVSIYGNKTFCQISTGEHHSIGLDKNGKVWAWGTNPFGNLGNNTTTDTSTPVAVYGNKTFCKISAGYYFSSALDLNGKAWSWGWNTSGQLGDNTITSKLTPVAVCGNKTFCHISSGINYSLGIDKNGKGWGWGINNPQALGDNTLTSRRTPVAICGNKTFCKIHAGFYTSLGIDKNGKGWGWGSNTNGNIGDNTFNARATPVAICGNKTFCEIAANNTSRHFRTSCGVDKNGKGWCWGTNLYGQIGDNAITNSQRATPVAICGNKTFCKISVGQHGILSIDKNGKVWAWGFSAFGELATANYLPTTPTLVSYI